MKIKVKRAICYNDHCNSILQYDTLSDTWFHINPEALKTCKVVGGKRTEPYYETIEISD